MTTHKIKLFKKRSLRVRNKLKKTSYGKCRLSIHRSSKNIYAQVIDDSAQKTICAASTVDKELREKSKNLPSDCNSSSIVGKLLASRAIKKGIKQVIFDRGGNLYHGRVKALAEAAREAGLEF